MIQGYHKEIPLDRYVADPAPEPSISKGVVLNCLKLSMRQARMYHPRLGGVDQGYSGRGEIGTAVHALVLGGAEIAYIDADDWRTKAAKDARDEARASGKIPLLVRQRDLVERAADAASVALREFCGTVTYEREVTMLWHDTVWCRGRADVLTEQWDIDLKTVDAPLDPHEWLRHAAMRGGYDVQARLRERGHEILGKPRKVVWLLVELGEPYETIFVAPGPRLAHLADRKIDLAIKAWDKCLRSGEWPGYSRSVRYADAPSVAEWDLADREVSRDA